MGEQLLRSRRACAGTSGPILSREIERDANGSLISAGRVYWFPAFAVLDEIEELRRHGFIEFRGTL